MQSISFNIQDALRVTPISSPPRVTPVDRTGPVGSIGSASRHADGIRSLVARVVPGKVDFSGDQPMPSNGLPFYRHPADRNVAATTMSGRVLDVEA